MQQGYVASNPIQSTPPFLYSSSSTTPTAITSPQNQAQVPYTTTQVYQPTQNSNHIINSTTAEPVFLTPSSINQQPFL